MRTLEVGLLATNVVGLLLVVLAGRVGFLERRRRAVWVAGAGAGVVVLTLHTVVEGVRVQMVFSYVFVGLFAGFALFEVFRKQAERKRSTRRTVLRGAVVGLAVVSLGLSAFLAYALPVPTLPVPTGGYAVGVQYVDLVDPGRDDSLFTGSTAPRQIAIKILYPAVDDSTRPYQRYARGSTALVRAALPGGFLFDDLTLARTHAKADLPLSDGQARYPVVLFSHALGSSAELYTSQCEDLASHGYVVVAIDHTYVAGASLLPGGLVTDDQVTTADRYTWFGFWQAQSQTMADDASFVIDTLTAMDEGTRSSIFAGRLSMDQVGMVGHSLGGAAAYDLAFSDSRVKAAISLDGPALTTPPDDASPAPFLLISSDTGPGAMVDHIAHGYGTCGLDGMSSAERTKALGVYHGTEAEQETAWAADCQRLGEQQTRLGNVAGASGTLLMIDGTGHTNFSDVGTFINVEQLRELPQTLLGPADPDRVLQITQAVTLAFFDQHLKGVPTRPLESVVSQYPQLHHVELGGA